ncbi:hypothetical protein [Thalassotalea sp. ND16A]|uniref:hypothetical protein n=1 Tax=Thalassotalea sp. ND16A TaxID=1535422 RepID=UPI000519F075|nr:hypothetical protein [Thalassotalea sp. ND16A]KGK00051.1 hypothetical protein ND16A_0242 [Thalassotalea sp. ND16A]
MIIFRNILAVLLGLVIGSTVNMAIVVFGPDLIPPPAGVDVTNTESIRASIHLFEPKHFLSPFLAHALGTLVGAFVAFIIAAKRQKIISLSIGVVFLAGGITASTMIPAPVWFIATDLILAYIPMAWVGAQLAQRFSKAKV